MSEPCRITVQVIDNEVNRLQAMLATLVSENITIIATHDDEIGALNFAVKHGPSVILLNHRFRGPQSAEYIGFLSKDVQSSKILLLGNKLSDDEVIKCLVSGAHGYLEFNVLDKFIDKAIKSIFDGEAWVTRRMVGLLLDRFRNIQ